jgi:hypothetical protein
MAIRNNSKTDDSIAERPTLWRAFADRALILMVELVGFEPTTSVLARPILDADRYFPAKLKPHGDTMIIEDERFKILT